MSKSIKILFVIALTIILFVSCSATETIITDKKISISVPAINDSIAAAYKYIPKMTVESLENIFNQLPDSAFIETIKTDGKKAKIKYYPKKKYFDIYIPAQKVDTTLRDTSKITIKKAATTPEKLGYGVMGIIVFIVLGAGIFLAVKFKLFA